MRVSRASQHEASGLIDIGPERFTASSNFRVLA
jgi:hypothetical protein